MEGADGGRRAEERQRAVADQAKQDEHVVALIGVPRPATGQRPEPEDRRQDQHGSQADQLGAVDRWP